MQRLFFRPEICTGLWIFERRTAVDAVGFNSIFARNISTLEYLRCGAVADEVRMLSGSVNCLVKECYL